MTRELQICLTEEAEVGIAGVVWIKRTRACDRVANRITNVARGGDVFVVDVAAEAGMKTIAPMRGGLSRVAVDVDAGEV